MNDRLQTQQFGPYFSSFLPHSYGYEAANELKSVLKLLDFRFGPYSRTGSRPISRPQEKDVSGVFQPWLLTLSLSSLPTLKKGSFFGLTLITSPVFGLRPI
jgi:hypothetical protein